jgi:phospholipase C
MMKKNATPVSSASRRSAIKAMAAAAASYMLPVGANADEIDRTRDQFGDITNIVVVMMENRSFDHMLGWVKGADGISGTRSYYNKFGIRFDSFALSSTSNHWGGIPLHGYDDGRVCFNHGKMDGFIKTENFEMLALGENLQMNPFPIGYFPESKLPFYSGCAKYFTIGDRYFSGFLGQTWPNRMYIHTGQTDRMGTFYPAQDGSVHIISDLVSIWDLAKEKGVSAKYYYSDLPATAFWGTRHNDISFGLSEFFEDAKKGTLPNISYVDPAAIGEVLGKSNDDHPVADVANGQAFLNEIYNALSTGPNWQSTLLIVTYDEWGGFADHVAPPMAPVSDAEKNLIGGGNDGRLGIRVPFLLIGPRARRNADRAGTSAVVSHQYDPNAVLNFICDRFGLQRLGVRGRTSGSIATALLPQGTADYSEAPVFKVERGDLPLLDERAAMTDAVARMFRNPVINDVCADVLARLEKKTINFENHLEELAAIMIFAKQYGFPV